MTNMKIRFKAQELGVPLWRVAQQMGISEPTMTRRMRKQLSAEEEQAVLAAIEAVKQQQEETDR